MITTSVDPTVLPPTTVNQPVAVATGILETIIEQGIVKGLLEPYAVSVFPPLGLPIISNLFDFALEQEGDYIATNLAKLLAAGIINIQVTNENAAFKNSWSALITAISSGDANATSAATTQLENDFNNLVGWDGA